MLKVCEEKENKINENITITQLLSHTVRRHSFNKRTDLLGLFSSSLNILFCVIVYLLKIHDYSYLNDIFFVKKKIIACSTYSGGQMCTKTKSYL